jgi:formate/nitrite transporter
LGVARLVHDATLVATDTTLGYGTGRLASGLAFSLGLIMLVVAGGELFTGNNLMVLAFASRKVTSQALLRNWGIAYLANAAGAVMLAVAIHLSGIADNAAPKATAIRIAEAKVQLGVASAFLRGVLCNILVCLAVWLSVAARSVEGKAIAIALPVSAFVALGFDHCIANFYLLPVGMLSGASVSLSAFIGNIVPVTVGNTLGGVMVATAYYLVFLSGNHVAKGRPSIERSDSSNVRRQVAVWGELFSEAIHLSSRLRRCVTQVRTLGSSRSAAAWLKRCADRSRLGWTQVSEAVSVAIARLRLGRTTD